MPFLALLIASPLALLCLWAGFRSDRRRRILEDTPTIPIRGAYIGFVELAGQAKCAAPRHCHLATGPCVFHRWSVTERWSRTETESYTDSKGNRRTRTVHKSGWRTMDEGGGAEDFMLLDNSGQIAVRMRGATIEAASVFDQTVGPNDPLYYGKGPREATRDSDHRRQFTEEAIALNAKLFICGQVQLTGDGNAIEVARDDQAPMYLISVRNESAVRRSQRWHAVLLHLLGLVLTVGGSVIVALQVADLLRTPVPLMMPLGAGLIYLGLWLLGAWLVVFNSLVNLRRRVDQAWANVDVQLRRRHDLIGQLLPVVTAWRDHEAGTQTVVASLRSQLTATPPGQPGPDPARTSQDLRALAEAYPTLTADDAFTRLSAALSDCEDRIAMARGFFNEMATFFNTRLQHVPEGWIGAVAGIRTRALLSW